MKKINFIILLTAIIGGCQEKRKDLEPVKLEVEAYFKNEADTLLYTMKTEHYTYPAHGKKVDATYVSFSYPVYSGNREDIDQYLNREVAKLLEFNPMTDDTTRYEKQKLVDQFFQDYTNELKENPEYIVSYGLENSIQPLQRHGNIITLSAFSYVFMGGAHPSHSILYHNYDVVKKKELSNSDLIDLKNPKLLTIAESNFRIQNEIPVDSSLSSMGYFWELNDGHPAGEFYLNENFGFERDSVIWLYNSYEIGAYAMGNPILKIPKSAVKEYMKE